jgi:ArsR family transcriptional regulator, arsenate/arsenite/antimonite-responsive transcriptional repressor / arsenate reductase (thioredoxin)
VQTKQAIEALAALAQEHRLAVFRLLIREGASGLPAGEIADRVAIPSSTLSRHLAHLEQAQLLRSWRVKRQIYYAVDIDGTRRLIAFLTEECCQGRPDICGYEGAESCCDEADPVAGGKQGKARDMTNKLYNVLFLCTGNSARSIIAESVLNRYGQGRFKAFSAGSHPTGRVHPYALDLLKHQNYPTTELRSKCWAEFAGPGAPQLDFAFTVCDNAANEVCPVWPGQPMTAHWGVPDPAAVEGPEAVKRVAFANAMRMLTQRISIFTSVPLTSLDKLSLQRRLDEIGAIKDQPSDAAE